MLSKYPTILKGVKLTDISVLELHTFLFFHNSIWSELWVFQMYISQKPTLQRCDIGCALGGLWNRLRVSTKKGNRTLLFTHFLI